jgi:hypothetical protein
METAETVVETPDLISIPHASRLAGVSRVHVWRLVQAGTIPAIRVGADDRGPIRIEPPVVHAMAPLIGRARGRGVTELPRRAPARNTR